METEVYTAKAPLLKIDCWFLLIFFIFYKIVLLNNFNRYFEGGVSSVYLWDLEHGFAGVILIKKAGDGSKKIKGCWDSIHVVEVQVRTI